MSITLSVPYILLTSTFLVNCIRFMFSQDKLAMNITSELGKTLKDSYSEVLRGLGLCLYCFFDLK